MKKIAILQSNYIPWKGYFDIIKQVDEFIFYDDVQYTKNDWRNRNKIKTSSGPLWLTIPVRQETLSQKINETKVSQDNWAEKHWKSISLNYSKAPFYNLYKERLELFFMEMKSPYLSEINRSAIELLNSFLGIKTALTSSADYKLIEGKNERLIDLILQAGGTHYLSGPSAKDYIREDLFKEAGIEISWMDYSGYIEYPQLFPPFVHAVSVLDLILNTGPDSKEFMK
ncbi:MAG TPA: WbqC family protein [Bacteroidia bacterium]|nr:WbqC family protein [Bacteroidia bacterium]